MSRNTGFPITPQHNEVSSHRGYVNTKIVLLCPAVWFYYFILTRTPTLLNLHPKSTSTCPSHLYPFTCRLRRLQHTPNHKKEWSILGKCIFCIPIISQKTRTIVKSEKIVRQSKEIIFDPWLLGNSLWQPFLRPILGVFRCLQDLNVSFLGFKMKIKSRQKWS